MKYKFAFDLGSTSCGWSVVRIDDENNVIGFEDIGVRIFPDGRDAKSKEPLQVARRNARGARVRNDRILQRRHKIIDLLKQNGMIYNNNNKDKNSDERKNPYELRAKAIDEKVSLTEFGRIMYNLSLRRGFKSNRKELQKEGGGKTNDAIKKLENELHGQTLGQYLCSKMQQLQGKDKIRFSNLFDGNKIKDGSIYPSRAMYEDEFKRIWSKQAEFYDILKNEDLKKAFLKAIFDQRPLKPQQRGFCEFEDGAYRIYKAHPLFQRFRALQTINQMAVNDQPLTQEQKQTLKDELFKNFQYTTKQGKLSFDKIKKLLGFDKSAKFNIEDEEKRKEIYADKTSYLLSRPERFGEKWFKTPFDEQCSIIDMLTDCCYNNQKEKDIYEKQQKEESKHILEDDEIKQFLKEHYNLDNEHCEKIINANLEPSTGSLSKKAIEKILPFLEEGLLYNDACKMAGYHHSWFDGDIKTLPELPYYGKVLKKSCVFRGKPGEEKDPKKYQITNISVHVALNQLRLVVNELIKKYGNPDSVAVEIARDLKMGTKELSKVSSNQAKNKKENERIIAEIQKKAEIQNPSREDIQKYKMWEMLSKDETNFTQKREENGKLKCCQIIWQH